MRRATARRMTRRRLDSRLARPGRRAGRVSAALDIPDPPQLNSGLPFTVGSNIAPTGVAPARVDGTVRIWHAIATPQMLCDKLTTNMSRKQWREWISPDIEYIKLCPRLPDRSTKPLRKLATTFGDFRAGAGFFVRSDMPLPMRASAAIADTGINQTPAQWARRCLRNHRIEHVAFRRRIPCRRPRAVKCLARSRPRSDSLRSTNL